MIIYQIIPAGFAGYFKNENLFKANTLLVKKK